MISYSLVQNSSMSRCSDASELLDLVFSWSTNWLVDRDTAIASFTLVPMHNGTLDWLLKVDYWVSVEVCDDAAVAIDTNV